MDSGERGRKQILEREEERREKKSTCREGTRDEREKIVGREKEGSRKKEKKEKVERRY